MRKKKIVIAIILAIAILTVVSAVTSTLKNVEKTIEPVKITDLRLVKSDNSYVLFTLRDEDNNVIRDCKGSAIVVIMAKTGDLAYREEFDVSHKDFHDMHYIGAYHFVDVYVLQIYEDKIVDVDDIKRIELIFKTPTGKELTAKRDFGM